MMSPDSARRMGGAGDVFALGGPVRFVGQSESAEQFTFD